MHPMKILIFYQYFSTPEGSWGTRIYDFAKCWVEKGHHVTVITSIYAKSDLRSTKFIEDQKHAGINVKVINIMIDNKKSFLSRMYSFMIYSLVSTWYALRLPADLVIASSGPITVGIPGLICKYFRRRKLVFEVRDLWPQGAIELGVLRNKLLIQLASWFEKKCYQASSAIVTLSPGMKTNISDRYQLRNIISITNAANLELFSSNVSKKPPIDGFYALYTGNIGVVNNSSWLYDAALILNQRKNNLIKIVMIGDGPLKEEIAKNKEALGLDNLLLMDLMPKNKLVSYVQNANVSLVPLSDIPVLNTSSPNKLFESLAAGVPVIQNTSGWIKKLLEVNNVGYTVDANNPVELAELLIHLFENPEIAKIMGERARVLAANSFNKDHLANKYLEVLTKVYEG